MSANEYGTHAAAPEAEIEVIEVGGGRPQGSYVRGSAIWAGAVTAIASFILLEMLLLATDLSGTQLGGVESGGVWIWDALAGVVAFFIGGAVAAAAVPYRSLETGALNGFVVWATAIAGLILLTGIAGGSAFGALGNVLETQQVNLQSLAQSAPSAETLAEDARNAAVWATLGLALALASAVAGGMLGGKMSPQKNRDQQSTR